MLSKLAFRNVRKTVRDYGVYLITMILVTALMFAFHSMMFSPQIKKLATVAGVMEAMIGIAAGFIVLIVSWLVRYIVAFMMEKRSREFGIYLLIGMNKKQIRKIFMKENTIFGLLAFVIGMVPGIFLEQVLTSFLSYFRGGIHDPFSYGTFHVSSDKRALCRYISAGTVAGETADEKDEYPKIYGSGEEERGGSGASPEMETDLSSAVDLLCNRVWRDPLYASDAYGKRDDSFGSTGFYDLSVL